MANKCVGKAALIDAMTRIKPYTKKEAGEILDVVFEAMTAVVTSEQSLKIPFGIVKIAQRKARIVRAVTGKDVDVPAKTLYTLKGTIVA